MFVPRQLQLRKPQRPAKETSTPAPPAQLNADSPNVRLAKKRRLDNTTEAGENGPHKTFCPKDQDATTAALNLEWGSHGERATKRRRAEASEPVDKETVSSAQTEENVKLPPHANEDYMELLVCGVALVFSEYAHVEQEGREWLEKHRRTVDGEDGYIHLSALLAHPILASLKPLPTQPVLRHALRTFLVNSNPAFLQVSPNGYSIRRPPTTLRAHLLDEPLPFFGANTRDTRASPDWERRIVYIEPHLSTMAAQPAKLAWWLQKHGKLRSKWLPVQKVHVIRPGCAFMVLAGDAQGVWEKRVKKGKKCKRWERWPKDWIVMPKTEHDRRREEYIALLEAERKKARMEPLLVGGVRKPLPQAALDVSIGPLERAPASGTKSINVTKSTESNKDCHPQQDNGNSADESPQIAGVKGDQGDELDEAEARRREKKRLKNKKGREKMKLKKREATKLGLYEMPGRKF